MVELQKAKERNERLDSEICVLRDRVRSLDTERRTLLKLARIIIFKIVKKILGILTCKYGTDIICHVGCATG